MYLYQVMYGVREYTRLLSSTTVSPIAEQAPGLLRSVVLSVVMAAHLPAVVLLLLEASLGGTSPSSGRASLVLSDCELFVEPNSSYVHSTCPIGGTECCFGHEARVASLESENKKLWEEIRELRRALMMPYGPPPTLPPMEPPSPMPPLPPMQPPPNQPSPMPPTPPLTPGGCAPNGCSALLSSNPAATDGYYTLTLGGGQSVNAFCDMSNGGWMALVDPSDLSLSYLAQFGETDDITPTFNQAADYVTFGRAGWDSPSIFTASGLCYSKVKADVTHGHVSSALGYFGIQGLSPSPSAPSPSHVSLMLFNDAHSHGGGVDVQRSPWVGNAVNGVEQNVCQGISRSESGTHSPCGRVQRRTIISTLATEASGIQLRGAYYSGYSPNLPKIHGIWIK